MPISFPHQIDLRPYLPPIRDQGQRSTCLSFAVTATHELCLSTGKEVSLLLSEEYLYSKCKQIDKSTVPTTTPAAARTALEQWGQPSAELWPYVTAWVDEEFHLLPKPSVDEMECYKADLQKINSTEQEMKKHLIAGSAIVIGLEMGLGFFETNKGIIPVPDANSDLEDSHAVVVVGYDDHLHGGCWVFRNSWGIDWGDGGYGYLPYEYINQHGALAWIVKSL